MQHLTRSCLIVIIILAGCSGPTNPGGSEITNGKVIALGGVPVSGVSVKAYPVSYVNGLNSASSVLSTITGSDGTFHLPIDSMGYNIFIVDTMGNCGKLLPDIGPGENLGTIILATLGAISVTLHRPDTLSSVSLYAYCKGTPYRQDLINTDSTFVFTYVPAGMYQLVYETEPLIGCIPGIDCIPGGSAATGTMTEIEVAGSTTVMIDITVSTVK